MNNEAKRRFHADMVAGVERLKREIGYGSFREPGGTGWSRGNGEACNRCPRACHSLPYARITRWLSRCETAARNCG